MTVAPERSSSSRLIAEQRRDQPDVVRLAESLCLAAQAEPHFVRGARLRFVPLSGTGLEARLWFSPLVEAADSRVVMLHPEVTAELRQELSLRDRELLRSVRDFTLDAHRDAPPLVRCYEELLWQSTVDPRPAEEDVARALAPLVHEVRHGGHRAAEASRWVLRFLPRLPGGVRDADAAWRLHVMAAERLGLDPPPGAAERAGAAGVRAVRTLVHTDIDIGVRTGSDGIVLSRPPEPDALVLQANGAARAGLRLRAALPGAGWHELDLYDGWRSTLGLGVVAEADTDGTVRAAQAELDGVVRAARAGHRAAVAVSTDGRTSLRVDDGNSVLSLSLPEPPTLLAVADTGPAATAVVTGAGLHVIGTALDGTSDSVLHRPQRPPTALGWTREDRQPVLCMAQGSDVALARDGDPRHIAGVLPHPAEVAHLWCSAESATVAVADADGGIHVHRLTGPGEGTTRVRATGPAVTALTGDPSSGAVVWACADGGVESWAGEGSPVLRLGLLRVPAISLALLPATGLVVAADGGPRLLRLPWPRPGPPTGVAVPFSVREAYAAPGGRVTLVGRGGDVEIRSEDERVHLVGSGPVPRPADRAGPAWARTSVGVALPGPAPVLPPRLRRWGIGHVRLPATVTPDSEAFAILLDRAREQGLRVVAQLTPPDLRVPVDPAGDGEAQAAGIAEGGAVRDTASAADVLVRAHAWLEAGVDGLWLCESPGWPAALARRLRHLVDAYPDAALLAAATVTTAYDVDDVDGEDGAARTSGAGCHLTIGPPPDPPAPAPGPPEPSAPGAAGPVPSASESSGPGLAAPGGSPSAASAQGRSASGPSESGGPGHAASGPAGPMPARTGSSAPGAPEPSAPGAAGPGGPA
ncbi:hypothetical protein, partial [Streptomyces sp. GC420]|uniref:hypothetical protein n=1 Tax=Streptomyces sp. GC420 TaxID=2697568 RepID=UPI001414D9B8